MKRYSVWMRMSVLLLGFFAIFNCSTISQAEEVDGIEYTGIDSIVITDYKGTASSLDLSEYFPDATEITIKDWAFAGATLTSITLPETVVSIGESAFDASSIQTITFSPDTQSLAFGINVFKDCANLASLDIPDCVTVIPEGLCYDCTSLLNVSLPDACTSIGSSAFYNCTSLISVSIPASCSSIGGSAFRNCKQLQSVNFEETENSDRTLILGSKVFENCEALTTISIPEGCTSIPTNTFWSCDSLRTITLPESCTSISNNVFAYCRSLSQINSSNAQEAILPQNCTSIGSTAFQECTSLKNIEIPEACTSIGTEAFAGCTGLNQVVFVNADTAIEKDAFPTTQKAPNIVIYCTNVGSVTIYAENASLTCESSVQTITVTSLPSVREYLYSANGELDLSGLVVKASVMSLSAETGYENKEVAIEDCIISSFDSAKAGKQTITITYGGKQTSFDVKVYYDIVNTTVTVQPAIYTGTAVVPTFVVFGNDAEQALVYETDYLYTCQNNIKVGNEATLTLVGIGVYKGEKTVTFSIIANEGSVGVDDKENSGNNDVDNSDTTEAGGDTETGGNTGENDNNGGDNNTIINNNNTTNNDVTNNNTTNNITNNNTVINNNNTVINNNPSGETEKKPVKGKTYTVKGMKYKVTSSTAVTFMKPVSKNIKKCTIPSTVEILGRLFKVTKINKKACYQCKKLTTVSIGNNVTTIEEQAFAKCTKLKTVSIGKGLKTVGKKAFYKDKNLKKIIIKSKKLKSVGKGAIKGVKKGLVIQAPEKKDKKYKQFFLDSKK